MSAAINHDALTEEQRYQLQATLQGLSGEREELRLAEITALSGVDGTTVRSVMQALEDDPGSPIAEVDDGVWQARQA